MQELQDEGCCEHKNCFITFDMQSQDPDLFTYFIMDNGEDQEKRDDDTEKESWERAAEADLIYVFCKIHAIAILERMEEVDGNMSINYMESIVKDPHFGELYGG